MPKRKLEQLYPDTDQDGSFIPGVRFDDSIQCQERTDVFDEHDELLTSTFSTINKKVEDEKHDIHGRPKKNKEGSIAAGLLSALACVKKFLLSAFDKFAPPECPPVNKAHTEEKNNKLRLKPGDAYYLKRNLFSFCFEEKKSDTTKVAHAKEKNKKSTLLPEDADYLKCNLFGVFAGA